MGKKKIPIEYIADPRRRKLCFDKRQQGLIKKAMELCKLARTDVGLIIMSEECSSLVEFWSGEKTGLVQRYQEMAATPHYDFTLDDYESEISNALALKPFPSCAKPHPCYQLPQCNTVPGNEERPLKRGRYSLEEDSSSLYSSQPPSPIQHMTDEPKSPSSALTSLDSLNSLNFQMEKPIQQLNSLQESLGKLCDNFNNNGPTQYPTLPSVGAAAAPPVTSTTNTIPTVGAGVISAGTVPPTTPTTENNNGAMNNNNNAGTPPLVTPITPNGSNSTSTTPMIADEFDAVSAIGDMDFSGLLSYINKTDTVPALPSPATATTPNFAGSTVWEVPTIGGASFI